MASEVVAVVPGIEFTEAEFDSFRDALVDTWGVDPSCYQPVFVRRQLRNLMMNRGIRNLGELQDSLTADPSTLRAVQAAFAVPVTEMFRDPAAFRALREDVVPELGTYPFIRVWSAGCATGEEAFSLSILLSEMGFDGRYRIYATDINQGALASAQLGVSSITKAEQNRSNYIASGGRAPFERYFVTDGKTRLLRRQWRDPIVFATHSLISDASFNDFQLILCRNVMIYFSREARENVYELLLASLTDYGHLVLGRNESPNLSRVGKRFHPTRRDARIYRKDPKS